MDQIKASPIVNPRMAKLAELLRKGKEFGNKAQIPDVVPLVGGQGVGDLLLGEAPDEVENWAYGNNPVKIPEMSNVPQISGNRKQGVADALGMVPFAGGGGAGQAMLAMGGDPRLILSRATYSHSLKNALSGKHMELGMTHPSFAIQKDGLPVDFGNYYILPHPAALDPKVNPNSELFNIDAYTGYPEPGRKDTRLLFDMQPDPEYALRIGVSPKFNSFADFENSPLGARTLLDPDSAGTYEDKAFSRLIQLLDEKTPNWYDKIPSDPQPHKKIIKDNPEIAPLVRSIRKASAIGQSHAELKHTSRFPISGATTQAVLYPGTDASSSNPVLETLRQRGVQVLPYSSEEEAVDIARELQKSAKFASRMRLPRHPDSEQYDRIFELNSR